MQAQAAGLNYVYDHDPGIGRKRKGKDFTYHQPDGKRIADAVMIARCKKLAVPPALE